MPPNRLLRMPLITGTRSRRNPITLVILCGLAYLGVYHYAKRPTPLKPVDPITVTQDQRPCIINGVLYTRLNETPIEQIKKVNI